MIEPGFRLVGLLGLVVALTAAAPAPAGPTGSAGSVPAAPAPADSIAQVLGAERALRPHVMLLGGLHGLGEGGLHPYGGLEAGAFFGRLGLMATGQYGSGNGFGSTLLAIGPAVEVVDLGFTSLTVHGGVARYGEETDAGFGRHQTGFHGALSVRVPLPVGAIGATAFLWHGRLRGEGVENPVGLTSHRFSVGFGF